MSFFITCSECGERHELKHIFNEMYMTDDGEYLMICNECESKIPLYGVLTSNELNKMWALSNEADILFDKIRSAHEGE